MPPRIHCPFPLSAATEAILPENAAHHVRQVLRLRPGEAVTLFDGEGGEYDAMLTRVDRREVAAQLGAHRHVERESPLAITLAQGVARAERMDFAIQKAVELGVVRIVPLLTVRCTVRLDDARAARRHEHWRGIITHACEQCGRNRLPVLAPVQTLEAFAAAESAAIRLTLDPGGAQGLGALVGASPTIALAVGPEGGFTPGERQLLAGHGYIGARLGPRILRTETAAMVALAILQSSAGDLR